MSPFRIALGLVCVCVLWIPGLVRAHHPAVETTRGHSRPTTAGGFDFEFARFVLQGAEGYYATTTAALDFAVLNWLSFGARVPFHVVRVESEADGFTRAGIGDLDFGVKVRIVDDSRFTFAIGTSLELPTGNEEYGLGGGHYGVHPYMTSMATFGPWMIHGTISENLGIRESESEPPPEESDGHDHDHDHGTEENASHDHVRYVSPHSDHELAYHIGVVYSFEPSVFVNVVANGVTILDEAKLGETLVTSSAEIGLRPHRSWQVSLKGEVPLTSERRFDWKLGLGARFLF